MSNSLVRLGLRARSRSSIHPWPLRVLHWLNALAIVVMIGSGWQIYDASPLFGFVFPTAITLGGWLAAGIAWHLAFMWLLLANGLCYVAWGVVTGHFRRRLWPLEPGIALREAIAALRLQLPAHRPGHYSALQRLIYVGVICAGFIVVISGLGIWKPVQFWFFTDLIGGYFIGRYVHFFAMTAICAFLVIHLLAVVLTPSVLPPMLFGGGAEAAEEEEP